MTRPAVEGLVVSGALIGAAIGAAMGVRWPTGSVAVV